jgi:hypothetical protein
MKPISLTLLAALTIIQSSGIDPFHKPEIFKSPELDPGPQNETDKEYFLNRAEQKRQRKMN